ncbi:MAG: DUF3467 domain-containing protein [Bacteroidota bacterium]|uniref:DUF3467 domain-containing protein n=1 Tax=Parabacteroides sp. FAFU027 TaxID=2922715 RepID=UPI001FAFDA98|nr:DUF3467 domain-containing protein [Parabacteroides sp. FAFU027]MDP4268730.1 DUF3467 domain-containing protein [Bacteroidota bacterium]
MDNLEIDLPENIAEGTYSNLAVITHNSAEFILDFVQMMPGVEKAKIKSRVIMAPENAKRLLLAISDNVGKYERKYGEIPLLEKEIDQQPSPTVLGPGGKA